MRASGVKSPDEWDAVALTFAEPVAPDARFGRVFATHAELCAILRDYASGVWPEPGVEVRALTHVIATHGVDAIAQRLAVFYQSIRSTRTETIA